MRKKNVLSGLAEPTPENIGHHIDQLLNHQLFNGAAALTPTQTGALIQLAPQTVRNKLGNGTFPFPVVEIGGRKMVMTRDIVAVLVGVPVVFCPSVQHQPRRPGRPLKRIAIKKRG